MAEENEEPMIKTPAEFGHFLLEKELGHGGMGGVYLGRDRMLDRPVGIKVMLKSLGDDPTFVERFQREAQAAARLNHPNIAQIYSFGTEQGMPYIAMELCTGGSLDKDMEKNPASMDPVKVMRLGRQLAEALALAAEQGLVHGDVKPENVLYDTEGNAKLVDFGLAAMQGDSNEIWGTPYYISPGKVRRQPIDYRADIYSLGGTLYHALTGQPPFEGVDATAVVKARFDGPPPKPSAIRPEIPKEIDDIIMRMLEVEPSMRYPTYESLLGDMRRYLDKAGPEKTATTSSRIRLKSRKPKMNLGTTAGLSVDGVAELTPITAGEAEGEGQKKSMSIGLIVTLVVLGIILAIGAVVGGLFWYVHAEKVAEEKAARQQVVQTLTKARDAIVKTKKTVSDFGKHFTELVAKSEKEMKDATVQVKAALSEEMLAAIGGSVQPPIADSPDIAEAKAYVAAEEAKAARADANEAADKAAEAEKKAEEAKEAAQAKTAPTTAAPAAAPAATNAPPAAAKADAKKDAKKPEAKGAKKDDKKPEAKDAKKDEKKSDAKDAKKPDAKDAKKDDKKPEVEEKPAEEAKAEEKPAKPPVELPPDLTNFIALWGDFYFCQASDIRVLGRVAILLKQVDVTLAQLSGEDAATAKKLAEYSNKLVDELGDIKAMKCVEQTLKKAGVIKSKSANLVKSIERQAARIRTQAEKAAKAQAAKEAAEAKAAKEAEEHKAKAEAEVKAVQEKWDALAISLVRHLSWDLCKKQLASVGVEFETQEGRDEIKMFQKRVEMMESFQRHLIAKAKGTSFLTHRGNMKTEVKSSNKDGLQWNVARKVKGNFDKGKDFKADWERFYQKPENRGLMKRLIVMLVVKGQDDSRTRVGPMAWANNMLGAALSMHVFMADDPELEYANTLVKKAVEGFEPCRKYAAKFFPDVDIGAAPTTE